MPLTCTTESKVLIDPITDGSDQLSESYATIAIAWELTDGTNTISGDFEISHDYENEYDPRPDVRALLQGNGEYHHPYTRDYHAMTYATKIKYGVLYLAGIRDPKGALCKSLKLELLEAIENLLPDYHKDWFMEILA